MEGIARASSTTTYKTFVRLWKSKSAANTFRAIKYPSQKTASLKVFAIDIATDNFRSKEIDILRRLVENGWKGLLEADREPPLEAVL